MKMNDGLKAVACAAAMAASATPAFAQTLKYNNDGSGTFIFSPNLLGGYSLISATVNKWDVATLVVGTDDSLGTITGTPGATYAAGAAAAVNSVTLNGSNDIVSITSTGGNIQNAPKSTAANGGSLIINNLSYNSATNIISADVSGANLAGTYTLATTTEQVFTVTALDYSADGGTTWNTVSNPATFAIPAAGSYLIRSSGLFLVGGNGGTVFNQFVNSLGLKGIGLSTLQALDTPSGNPAGFGTLTVSGSFSPVPEAETYLSFGLGLTGLASLGYASRSRSRRRAKA